MNLLKLALIVAMVFPLAGLWVLSGVFLFAGSCLERAQARMAEQLQRLNP